MHLLYKILGVGKRETKYLEKRNTGGSVVYTLYLYTPHSRDIPFPPCCENTMKWIGHISTATRKL